MQKEVRKKQFRSVRKLFRSAEVSYKFDRIATLSIKILPYQRVQTSVLVEFSRDSIWSVIKDLLDCPKHKNESLKKEIILAHPCYVLKLECQSQIQSLDLRRSSYSVTNRN